jgi:hypothetical protein
MSKIKKRINSCDTCGFYHDVSKSCQPKTNHANAHSMLGMTGTVVSQEDKPVWIKDEYVKIINKPGDGDCAFHSLGYFTRPMQQGNEIRGKIIEYIKQNKHDTQLKKMDILCRTKKYRHLY